MNSFRVLITRPKHQAQNLCAQISDLGWECMSCPTIEILPTVDKKNISQIFEDFSSTDAVIFVSANAVLPIAPYWPQKPPFPAVFATGPGTARALQDFSISAILPADDAFNSEGLLALPQLQNIVGKNIVIFSGEGGRTLLQETLRARGSSVKQIPVYMRRCPQVNLNQQLLAWQQKGIDVIITSSQESLENLWTMVGESGRKWLQQQQLLVISEKMRSVASHLGFILPPLVAKNASDAAILEVLKQKFQQ